ncbi:hypothetical protein WDZ92_34315, partial [Nostoc sp. NIES-2111]
MPMIRSVAAAILVAGLLSMSPAAARKRMHQEFFGTLVGTNAVSTDRIEAHGELRACALGFLVVLRGAPRHGGFIRVLGSIGMIKTEREGASVIAPYLKLVVHDIDATTLTLTPRRPLSGSFAVGGISNAPTVVTHFEPPESPGSAFIVFSLNPSSTIVANALATRMINVEFRRANGEPDIRVDIDLTVAETGVDGVRVHSPKAVEDMQGCLASLLGFDLQ